MIDCLRLVESIDTIEANVERSAFVREPIECLRPVKGQIDTIEANVKRSRL
jgi:hypothetical protein